MTACLWCSASFAPRESGGKAQKFCRPAHRRAFDRAAREYVVRAIETGRLSHAELQGMACSNAALGADGLVAPQGTELASSNESNTRIVAEASAPDWALAQ